MARTRSRTSELVRQTWPLVLRGVLKSSERGNEFFPKPSGYRGIAIHELAKFVTTYDPSNDDSQDDYAKLRVSWLRDLKGWLSGRQTASPDKIRRFCFALGGDWLMSLAYCRYLRHVVCMIDALTSMRGHDSRLSDVIRSGHELALLVGAHVFYPPPDDTRFEEAFRDRIALQRFFPRMDASTYAKHGLLRVLDRAREIAWPHSLKRVPNEPIPRAAMNPRLRAVWTLCDTDDGAASWGWGLESRLLDCSVLIDIWLDEEPGTQRLMAAGVLGVQPIPRD